VVKLYLMQMVIKELLGTEGFSGMLVRQAARLEYPDFLAYLVERPSGTLVLRWVDKADPADPPA
jgi:hypothetical protein